MAWSIRPGFRGDLVLCDEVENSECRKPLRTRAGYEPARWCAESRAACSVACLEWICGERGPCGRLLWPDGCRYRFWKPYLQKRLRVGSFCGGKHLGCLYWGRQGITVRTKWQSGIQVGNACAHGSNGNGLLGNGRFYVVKHNPT